MHKRSTDLMGHPVDSLNLYPKLRYLILLFVSEWRWSAAVARTRSSARDSASTKRSIIFQQCSHMYLAVGDLEKRQKYAMLLVKEVGDFLFKYF